MSIIIFIFFLILENNDTRYVYIANIHSIVISIYSLSFVLSFLVSVLACSSLFSDILDLIFVHTFNIFFCWLLIYLHIVCVFALTLYTRYTMGIKFTKNKNVSISGKINEQQKETMTNVANTKNQLDLIINENNQQLKKKNKTKKDEKLNRKSSIIMVDSSTNTDDSIFNKQQINDQANNIISTTTQVNTIYPSEISNNDVQNSYSVPNNTESQINNVQETILKTNVLETIVDNKDSIYNEEEKSIE